MKQVISDSYFYFREVEDTDHEWLFELHNDPLVLHNITNPEPITLESHLKWWTNLNRTKEKRYIFCSNSSFAADARIGFVKFYNVDKMNNNCLLGADIHKTFRGMGLAKPMWRMMLKYSFEVLDLHRVSLTVAEYNHIAQNVYEGVGFEYEGTVYESLYRDGKYYDQYYMYMTKKDYAAIL